VPTRWSSVLGKYAVPVVIVVALSGGGLAMCGLPGDSLDDGEGITGTYVVNGVDPTGVEYSGTVIVESDGDVYRVQWLVTGSIQAGVGTVTGDVFTVDWRTVTDDRGGSSGTAEYVIGADGTLRGERFVDGVAEPGTEEIFPEP
jgi:hypothetical protein